MTARFPACATLSIDIICQTLTFILICLRLYVAFYLAGRIKAPDVFIVLSWLFFLGNTLRHFLAKRMGLWDPRVVYQADGSLPPYDEVITNKKTLKSAFVLTYSTASAYYVSLYFVKMTFLFLYKQIFPVDMKKLRFAVYFMIGFVTVGYGVIVGMMFFYCIPIWRNWTLNPKERCLTWAAIPPYFFGTGFHIITDIMIYILPFFIFPRLYNSCSRRKFIGIISMFSLGLLCILSSVARIVNASINSSAKVIAVWCTVEETMSITVACILPIKRLWDVSHGRTSSVGRKRSRSWTRSRTWSQSMGWARRWRNTDGDRGRTGTRTWTNADVETMETGGGGTVGSGGLAPRQTNNKPDGDAIESKIVDAEHGTERVNDEIIKALRGTAGYLSQLLGRGEKNSLLEPRLTHADTSYDSEKQKAERNNGSKKAKKQPITPNLTFGSVADTPGTFGGDGVSPVITPTQLPVPLSSTFGPRSISSGSRETLENHDSGLRISTEGDALGQQAAANTSVGSLTFGPRPARPELETLVNSLARNIL